MTGASDVVSRIQVRAALTSAPTTVCSAEEVAFALALPVEDVERLHPAHAGELQGGRVAAWRDWLAALGHRPDLSSGNRPPESPPLTTWREVAEAVGFSIETVRLRRLEHAPAAQPYFENVAAARAWWRGLTEPPPTVKRRAAPRRASPTRDPQQGAPFDPAAERRKGRL